MAFQQAQQSNNTAPQNDSWKSQAFINISLPKADGTGFTKLGAIALKTSNKYEAALIKRLSEDPASLEKMLSVMKLDFRLADDPKAPAPQLPF